MPQVPRRLSFQVQSRRSHKKSRGGCTRCKKLRKKCDETRPSCSRCDRQNHSCRYTAQHSRIELESVNDDLEQRHATHASSDTMNLGHPDFSQHGVEAHSDQICDVNSSFLLASTSPASSSVWRFPQQPDMLNSLELELLSHYITHTSRTIPFDEDDLYALNVGIPNLAFGSKPVMASILALSAACKCHDIMKNSAGLERLEEVKELLLFADNHHSTSLHQIRTAIFNDDELDSVLANSALMVLYGLSNHRVRINLATNAKREDMVLPNEVLPLHLQWLTLIRAAYTAYVGLLNDHPREASASPRITTTEDAFALTPLSINNTYTPEDGPAGRTRRLLLPIVSATYRSALARLDARVRSIPTGEPNLVPDAASVSTCITTLMLLEDIFIAVLDEKQSAPQYRQSEELHISGQPNTTRLHKASPWLRKYLAHVTSAIPSKLLRRSITAFINRVPLDYLRLIRSALDCVPAGVYQTTGEPAEGVFSCGREHLHAIDIFAHWLVLVMLLDGVWWVGDIGQWELERVITFARAQGWVQQFTEAGKNWWPESMYTIKKELTEEKI